jgi:hypothetical protein
MLRFICVNVIAETDFLLRNAAFGGGALFTCGHAPRLSSEEGFAMRSTNDGEKGRAWLADYSEARARAIEWLGDRYLLARPINRRPAKGFDAGQPWIRKEKVT